MLKEFTVYLKIENLAVDEIHKKKYLIQPGRGLVLGRSKEANIVLIDENVSRKHAKIAVDGDTLLIKDLKSGNGTFVNGEQVTAKKLEENQLIVIGGFEIRVMKIVGAPSKVMPDDIVIEEDDKVDISVSNGPDSNVDLEIAEGLSSIDGADPWEGKLNVNGYIEIVKSLWSLFAKEHLDFFKKVPLVGTVRNSLIVIAISSTIPQIIIVLLGDSNNLSSMIIPFFTIGFVILNNFLNAKIYAKLKNWLKLEGDFEKYLRYYAMASVFMIPVAMLAIVPIIGAFAALFGFGFGILFYYGFYLRFKPLLGKFIVSSCMIFILMFLLQSMTGILAIFVSGLIAPQESPSMPATTTKPISLPDN